MWLWQGMSVRRMVMDFNNNKEYVSKYGTVSVASVSSYVRGFRRDAEQWLDEDALEKYTAEFVRKQHTIDEQIDKLVMAQKLLDQSDPKQLELFLKFENSIHQMHMNQIKMMSEIELVLTIKKYNKERRLKNETIVKLPDISNEDVLKAKRGYLSVTKEIEDNDVPETRLSDLSETQEGENTEHSRRTDTGDT
jgi:hypothetical protein